MADESNNNPTPPETPTPPASQTDYAALYGTDTAFKGFIDTKISDATASAVATALANQKRANDEQLSEAERLSAMSPEEKAAYYQRKFAEEQQARARDKDIDTLRATTSTAFKECGIPDDLLGVLDFETLTSESVKTILEALSKYDYFQKGAFDAKLQEALNDKLKQPAPGGSKGTPNNDAALRKMFGLPIA